MTTISGPDDVLAVLTSEDLTVPPAPAEAGPPSLAWLRARVARFSTGVEHERRRSRALAVLAAAPPDRLRERAQALTAAILAGGGEIDLMADVARVVPVTVLAEALGLAGERTIGDGGVDRSALDVASAAPLYLTGAAAGPETAAADAAVARLVAAASASGGSDDGEVAAAPRAPANDTDGEIAAALVGVLIQAYEATAGLIGNAALALLREGPGADADVGAVVARTLREDPPTLATRRVATVDTVIGSVHIGCGETVRVDLASAGLTLGAGPHACPGAEQARAIATGVLNAVRGRRLAEREVAYGTSPNLRVPARLRLQPMA